MIDRRNFLKILLVSPTIPVIGNIRNKENEIPKYKTDTTTITLPAASPGYSFTIINNGNDWIEIK